jgi:anti-sigma factor ChrR (cupin superfamily)
VQGRTPAEPLVLADLPHRTGRPDFPWKPYLPGIEIHRIYGDDSGGPSAALLRYQPGASAPEHAHPGYEHIYIVSGEQSDARGVYGAGTFVVNPPGTTHAVASPKGCVVLIVKEQPVVFTDASVRRAT